MNKIKKVFISLGVFFSGLISKTFAASLTEQTKYGVFDPGMVEDKYGVLDPRMYETKYGIFEPEPTIGEKILNIGKFALPVILFVIGLFVVLNKKITKKAKIIAVSILAILAIIGYILMNYMATNL